MGESEAPAKAFADEPDIETASEAADYDVEYTDPAAPDPKLIRALQEARQVSEQGVQVQAASGTGGEPVILGPDGLRERTNPRPE